MDVTQGCMKLVWEKSQRQESSFSCGFWGSGATLDGRDCGDLHREIILGPDLDGQE